MRGAPRLMLGVTVPRDTAADVLASSTLDEASRILGVCRDVCLRWRRELGLKRTWAKRLEQDIAPEDARALLRGVTVSEGQRRLGVSRRVVRRWMQQLGIKPARYRKAPPAEVVRAMRAGMTAREASVSLGRPERTVARWFAAMRRQHETQRA